MAQGYSIHIGLNHIDTTSPAYAGVSAPVLSGCLNDANAMEALATGQGFKEVSKLLDDQATAANVLGAISNAADNLESGDILLVTYSGHGSQVADQNGDEDDGMDETWVLWDRMLVDDELNNQWAAFKAGVRILMLSDSCHSGTVAREFSSPSSPPMRDFLVGRGLLKAGARDLIAPAIRRLERDAALRAGQLMLQHYPGATRMRVVRSRDIGATVLLISGCQDNQTSLDGDQNGLFTQTLLEVWNSGAFQGDYHAFHSAILAKMPPTQSPNYDVSGAANAIFEGQRPFTIDGAATSTSSGSSGSTSTTNGGDPSATNGTSTGDPSATNGTSTSDPSATNGTSTSDPSATSNGSCPTVTGPSQVSRNDGPPCLEAHLATNPYYFVEIASDPALFPPGADAQRTSATWYATWSDPSQPARLTGTTFAIPQDAWDALKVDDRLYFRIGTTSTADGWDGYVPSTYDDQADGAPSMSITD